MKETRMPPPQSANLAANSGNTIYGVGVIDTTRIGKNPTRALCLAVRGPYGPHTVPARAVHELFTISKRVRGP